MLFNSFFYFDVVLMWDVDVIIVRFRDKWICIIIYFYLLGILVMMCVENCRIYKKLKEWFLMN